MKEDKRVIYIGDLRSIHLVKWVKAFIDRDYRIKVVSASPVIEEDLEGYEIDYTVIPGLYSNSKKNFLPAFLNLRKIIKSFDPHIIHIHYMPSNFTNLFYYRGLKNLVISVWGSDIVYDNQIKPESIRQNFYKRSLLKQAKIITATSNFLKNKVLEYSSNAKNVEVIPFGVDTEKFKPVNGRKEKEKITISFIKHLMPKYGPSSLIKAFSMVAERYPNIELYMAGEGELKYELIKLARDLGVEEKVHFTGHIPHKSVFDLLKRTDILVMPSIYESETFGVTALEASSMEIPVIASRVGGVHDAVKDGKTGFLVEKKNVEQLADAMIKLIKNAKLRELMGKQGQRLVKERYEWNKSVDQMIRIYEESPKKLHDQKETVYKYRNLYSDEYFRRVVGNEDFANLCFASDGLAPTPYTEKPMQIANVDNEDRVLDIGCGRGEIIAQCTSKGAFSVGVDFSEDAVHIADSIIKKTNKRFNRNSQVLISDGVALPFKENYFSVVFLLDIVEHIYPEELKKFLNEVYRVLKIRGKIIIHSTPNKWRDKFGYIIDDIFLKRRKPKKPVERQKEYLLTKGINPKFADLHINKQTIISMKKYLSSAGFQPKVWYDRDGNYWSRKSPKTSKDYIISTIYRILGLKFILGESILGFGIKG